MRIFLGRQNSKSRSTSTASLLGLVAALGVAGTAHAQPASPPPTADQPQPGSSNAGALGGEPKKESGAPGESEDGTKQTKTTAGGDVAKPTLRVDSPSIQPEKWKAEASDYNGRPQAQTAGDTLIWIPRVVLFPLYVVTEYGIRVPLQAFTVFVERHNIVDTLKDVFIFGPDNNIGIVPTGLIDFGFRPSVGIYGFYDQFLTKNNGLRIHAATGGPDYLRATVTDSIGLDKTTFVKLRFEGATRPDYVFYGVGPRALEVNRSRYESTSFDGQVSFWGEPRPGNVIQVYSRIKDVSFNQHGYYGDDPPLGALIALKRVAQPAGLGGYTALRQGAFLTLDSRAERPAPGSGVRFEARGEHNFDLRDPGDNRWVRWGGALGGFLDITGHNRVLSLSVAADFADPLGDGAIPFTELATLGGDFAPMHGYLQGRLYDRSALSATLEYRWPIWSFLDGAADFAMGNVFGEHFKGFEPDLLRMSWTVGMRSAGARDHSFNIMIGSGTETFKDGAKMNDLRFEFGAVRGF